MDNVWKAIEVTIAKAADDLSVYVRSFAQIKGAVCLTYRDIGHAMSQQHVFQFVDSDTVRLHLPKWGIQMIDTYDTQKEFMVVVTVGVSKAALKKNENDALIKIFAVPLVEPATATMQRLQDTNEKTESVISGNCCRYCQKAATGMRKCAACKCVRYCSKACQRNDWMSHKVACRLLKEAKKEGAEELKGHDSSTEEMKGHYKKN